MQRRRGHVRLDPGGGQGRAGTNRQVVEGKKLLALVKQVIASRSKHASSTSSSSLIAQLKCVQHQKWLQSKTDKKTRTSSMSALVNPIRVSASKTPRWVGRQWRRQESRFAAAGSLQEPTKLKFSLQTNQIEIFFANQPNWNFLCKPTVLKPNAGLCYDEGGKCFPPNGKSLSNRWWVESFVAEAAPLLFLNRVTRGNKGRKWEQLVISKVESCEVESASHLFLL